MSPNLLPYFFLDPDHEEHSREEEGEKQNNFHTKINRGIYLLPNSLTLLGLFAGFYSIIAGIQGRFESATISLFVAMLMDFLDGRVARLTHTQSLFGAELDSLADIVSFGMTPALLVYTWSLCHLGKIGWLISFLFTAASALRLARFNSRSKLMEKNYFEGLPVPAGAGILCSFIWIGVDSHLSGHLLRLPLACLTILISLLMVSNLPYQNFKQVNFKGRVPFIAILTVLFVLVGIAIDPPKVLFFMFLIYSLSAPVIFLYPQWAKRRTPKKSKWVENSEQNALEFQEDEN
jgi:CDP-diacylglycerol--serine O-phosphatidyltransferase